MKKINLIVLIFAIVLGILLGGIAGLVMSSNQTMSYAVNFSQVDEYREQYISMKDSLQEMMMDNGLFSCCLVIPCTYCLEKTPGHGKGAACNCLEDVINGRNPCGECIGEILEGHGNRFLAKYFATAIAEEVGVEHIDSLKKIIEEKYGLSVAEQI